MHEFKVSASVEDYLEIIYSYSNNPEKLKAVNIANELNISRASVTEALQKLALKGYLKYEKNHPITLTEIGLKIAKEITHKHNILCEFFMKILDLEKKEAEINACKIEHVITPQAFEKIQKLLNK